MKDSGLGIKRCGLQEELVQRTGIFREGNGKTWCGVWEDVTVFTENNGWYKNFWSRGLTKRALWCIYMVEQGRDVLHIPVQPYG